MVTTIKIMGTIYNSGQVSEGISGSPQQKSAEIAEKQGQPYSWVILTFYNNPLKMFMTLDEIYDIIAGHARYTKEEILSVLQELHNSGIIRHLKESFDDGKTWPVEKWGWTIRMDEKGGHPYHTG